MGKKKNKGPAFEIYSAKKDVKMDMIKIWRICKTDFMGYEIDKESKTDSFSYHHLRVPASKGGKISIYNGAILCRDSAHDYIHVIEKYDKDRFLYITKILIEINNQLYLPTEDQLMLFDAVLSGFEREYSGVYNSNGTEIIKENYVRRRKRF